MNWTLLIGLALILAISVALVAALIFYLRHWESRQWLLDLQAGVFEGDYFKRYIPPTLRTQYDQLGEINAESHSKSRRTMRLVTTTILIATAFVGIVTSLLIHRDKYLPVIELTEKDLQSLRLTSDQWSARNTSTWPTLDTVLPELKKRGFVLVSASNDHNWRYQGVDVTTHAADQWRHLLDYHSIPYVSCIATQLNDCVASSQAPLHVLLPGHWDLPLMDTLLTQGGSVIAYGPPARILEDPATQVDWHGMTFEAGGRLNDSYLGLRGDQVLSLGFDAGLVLEASPTITDYRVASINPQAVAIGSDLFVGGQIDTRMYATRVGHGRLVWMDFAPFYSDNYSDIHIDLLEAVTASIFRYLLGQSYMSIATWPRGLTYAGLIEEDTEDQYANAKNILEIAKTHGFPITWFVLSNLSQRHRALTRELADFGEIACHGDSHLPFTKGKQLTQTTRLARCQKVLRSITGKTPLGFRPPEERFNLDTLAAANNVGMTYIFGESGTDKAVPTIFASQSLDKTLISLPRIISDDFNLWVDGELDFHESLALIDAEINWVKLLGGLYAFSFHSQFMDDADHLQVVERIGLSLQNSDAFFATAKEIADWWRFRSALIEGKPSEKDSFDRFVPMLLQVSESGDLTSTPVRYTDVQKEQGS